MKKLLILILLTATSLIGRPVIAGQVSFGIRFGPPPAPPVIGVVPASPGPGYQWIDGYWYPVGHNWRWHQGYWTRAPYQAPIGRLHIIKAENTTAATGKVGTARSSIITIGTAIEIGTIGTSTNTIMTMIMITTTTKQSPLPHVCGKDRAHAIHINTVNWLPSIFWHSVSRMS